MGKEFFNTYKKKNLFLGGERCKIICNVSFHPLDREQVKKTVVLSDLTQKNLNFFYFQLFRRKGSPLFAIYTNFGKIQIEEKNYFLRYRFSSCYKITREEDESLNINTMRNLREIKKNFFRNLRAFCDRQGSSPLNSPSFEKCRS